MSRASGFAVVATAVTVLTTAFAWEARSESVKYNGLVDLKPFECQAVTRSSFIQRVCYDRSNEYMLINLSGTYYHYCEIDKATVSVLLAAESMGRFFNSAIKGQFDCRTRRVPKY
jgi:hypothetical protein